MAREVRTRETTRVLDDATRYRRQKKAIEALEQDNFHDEPHADLVMSKKAPKFQDIDTTRGGGPSKKRKSRTAEYYKLKYGRNIRLLIDELLVMPEIQTAPNYLTAQAPNSKEPKRHFCSVCGFLSAYTCIQCGSKFCKTKCLETHKETRCLKWTS